MQDLISAATLSSLRALLLKPRDAAKLLAISERTLFELARRGEIKRIKIFSSIRYDLRDLDAFIQAKKQAGGA